MTASDYQRTMAQALRVVEQQSTMLLLDDDLRVQWAEPRFQQQWPACVGKSLDELTVTRVPDLMLTRETLLDAEGGVLALTFRTAERGIPMLAHIHQIPNGLLLLLLPLGAHLPEGMEAAVLTSQHPPAGDGGAQSRALGNVLQDYEELQASHAKLRDDLRQCQASLLASREEVRTVAACVSALTEGPPTAQPGAGTLGRPGGGRGRRSADSAFYANGIERLLEGIGQLLGARAVARVSAGPERVCVGGCWNRSGVNLAGDLLASHTLAAIIAAWPERAAPELLEIAPEDDALRSGLGCTQAVLLPGRHVEQPGSAVCALFDKLPADVNLDSPALEALQALLLYAEARTAVPELSVRHGVEQSANSPDGGIVGAAGQPLEANGVFEAIPVGIVLLDVMQREVVRANQAALRMFRCELADLVAGKCPKIFESCHSGRCFLEQVCAGMVEGRDELLTSDGRRIPVLYRAVRMLDGVGERVLLSLVDAAPSLDSDHGDPHDAGKLEAIGRLAAGIAHEINTPTQFVGDNTRFFEDSYQDLMSVLSAYEELHAAAKSSAIDEAVLQRVDQAVAEADLPYVRAETPKAIEQSLEGVQRVTEIVRAMRDFSHQGSEEIANTDLNHAIESTVTVARNEWKYVADVELDLSPHLPAVPCHAGIIQQVILNLIINAAHAVSEATAGGNSGKGVIRIRTRLREEWVEIAIEDTGCGIPADVRDRVFEPFFTTKARGRGTGQGLALAHAAIAKRHEGKIWFETAVGQGTTFYLHLPVAGPSRRPAEIPRCQTGGAQIKASRPA